jgi:glycosyltransferase involved in cell wall biosynthesis
VKILHINTSDYGGAATAIIRIHLALLEKGIDSKILLLKKTKDIPHTYSFHERSDRKKRQNIVRRVFNKIIAVFFPVRDNRNLIRDKMSKVEVFSFPTSKYDITQHPLYKDADIIQLNWVSGFLDEPSFFKKNKKPVVWRMADLYACGGGNHYETGFPFDDFKRELAQNYAIRKKALAFQKISLVPISNWVKAKAEQSDMLKNFSKHVIHNGINVNIFKPINRQFAREVFSLPVNDRIILFGADGIHNERKGFSLLLKALSILTLPKDTTLCVFGSVKDSLPAGIVNVGRVNDERLLCVLYAAADLFVMPSIEEAFGQVTIEALACGTPVVSFPNGGGVDIIVSGQNGVLAKDFSANSLADAISLALNTSFDRASLRKHTIESFNINDKADQYISLYSGLINSQHVAK